MRVGVMLDTNVGAVGRAAPDRAEIAEFHRWFLDCARRLDGTAVDGLFVAERHGRTDCLSPAPLEQLAALAAATEHCRLGSYVMMPPLYPAAALLERLAVIDYFSGGRLVWGVGAGFHPEYFAVHERPMRGRGGELDRLLAQLDEWAAGRFTSDGTEHYVLPPLQQPRPPVWVGGTSPAAVRRAARYGDAFAIGFTDAKVGELVEGYRRECAAVGRTPRLALIQSAWVRDDGEQAREEVVRELGPTFGPEMALYQEHGQVRARGEIDVERMLPYMYVGTPAEVCDRVRSDAQRWGIDDVVLRVHIGIPPRDAVTDCLDSLATHVVPQLAGPTH